MYLIARSDIHECETIAWKSKIAVIVTCSIWVGGCATAEQSDRPAATSCIGSGCALREPQNSIASLGPQLYPQMGSYYSTIAMNRRAECSMNLQIAPWRH
jgi:hypothetical protein